MGLALMLSILAFGGCGERREGHAARADESDATLFLAGDGEMWVVDVETQRAEHIRRPELIPGDPPHKIVAIGDRLAMWSYDVTTVPISDPSAPAEALVRDGWIFIPAADPDRIWVGFLDPESPATERGLGELREIDSSGDVITRGVESPYGAWPYAEVGGGLLFQGHRPTLWDPDSGQTLRSWEWDEIGDMGPVSDSLLASSFCRSGDMVLTDVEAGDQRRFEAPEGLAFIAWAATFSPDGATLAVPIWNAGCGQDADKELALLDVETGDIELIPGSRVPAGYVFTAWSRDGDEVFLMGGERFKTRQIVVYRVGEERARTLDVDVGDFYDVAAR